MTESEICMYNNDGTSELNLKCFSRVLRSPLFDHFFLAEVSTEKYRLRQLDAPLRLAKSEIGQLNS